jgi:hypothetical protein
MRCIAAAALTAQSSFPEHEKKTVAKTSHLRASGLSWVIEDGYGVFSIRGSYAMTKIRSDAPKAAKQVAAKKPKAKTQKKAAFGKKTEAKASGFPRTAWENPAALNTAIKKSKDRLGLNDHPRLSHRNPATGQNNGPPVVMRYGVVRPPAPPVVMRYGVIRPPVDNGGGGGTVRPPVVMRYGVIRPPVDNGGGGGTVRPPVVMRYGVIRPPIDDGTGGRPPIAMRYGVMRPRNPDVTTGNRRGIQ